MSNPWKSSIVPGAWQVWSESGQLLFVGPYAEANAYAKAHKISPLNVVRG